MEQPLRTSELASRAGISLSYASEIVNQRRKPGRSLAIHILRTTGWRHPSIDGLTDEQLTALEQVDPWAPRTTDAAA